MGGAACIGAEASILLPEAQIGGSMDTGASFDGAVVASEMRSK